MTSLSKSLFISLIIGLSLSIIFSMISNGEHYYPLAPDSTFGQLYYQHFNGPTVMLLSIIIWLLIGMVFLQQTLFSRIPIGVLLLPQHHISSVAILGSSL